MKVNNPNNPRHNTKSKVGLERRGYRYINQIFQENLEVNFYFEKAVATWYCSVQYYYYRIDLLYVQPTEYKSL